MPNGIVYGHAYTLLDIVKVNSEGTEVILFKLRNPWGSGEWKGDWSDSSDKWTDELKAQVGLNVAEDGVFYIDEENYLKEYSVSTVGFVDEGAKHTSKRVSHAKGSHSIVEIDIA